MLETFTLGLLIENHHEGFINVFYYNYLYFVDTSSSSSSSSPSLSLTLCLTPPYFLFPVLSALSFACFLFKFHGDKTVRAERGWTEIVSGKGRGQ